MHKWSDIFLTGIDGIFGRDTGVFLLKAPGDGLSLLPNFLNQKLQLNLLTFLTGRILIILDFIFLPSKTITIGRFRILFNVEDFHFLVDSFFRVFFSVLLLGIALVLLFYGVVALWTYFERLDHVVWPWLQVAYVLLVEVEICVVWGVSEGYSWHRSLLWTWQVVWCWLLRFICDKCTI